MTDAHYVLHLRSDAGHARVADRTALITQLTRIPGIEAQGDGPGRYTFGEADESGRMTIEFRAPRADAPASDVCDAVEIRIPRPWVLERGPRVFALVFMLAEWAKWEVFDPQIGAPLQKEAVLSGLVAMRQAKREHEDAARRAPASTTKAETYVPQARPATKPPARGPWWKPRS